MMMQSILDPIDPNFDFVPKKPKQNLSLFEPDDDGQVTDYKNNPSNIIKSTTPTPTPGGDTKIYNQM
jgi:hypothetical protein